MTLYSPNYDPPAPLLSATVTSTLNRRRRQTLSFLLDTGSDFSAIPEETTEHLKLYPVRRLQFEDLHASLTTVFTYKVWFVMADLVLPQIEVVPTRLEVGIIGRDILNHFNLHLYGPRQVFELTTE